MIREQKTIRAYEGNTCYCGASRGRTYDAYHFHFGPDLAWDMIYGLLACLRNGDTELSLSFYDELKGKDE